MLAKIIKIIYRTLRVRYDVSGFKEFFKQMFTTSSETVRRKTNLSQGTFGHFIGSILYMPVVPFKVYDDAIGKQYLPKDTGLVSAYLDILELLVNIRHLDPNTSYLLTQKLKVQGSFIVYGDQYDFMDEMTAKFDPKKPYYSLMTFLGYKQLLPVTFYPNYCEGCELLDKYLLLSKSVKRPVNVPNLLEIFHDDGKAIKEMIAKLENA